MAKRTKTERLIAALEKGDQFTSAQITNRFGLQNPTSTVNRLRNQGVNIATIDAVVRGKSVDKYAM